MDSNKPIDRQNVEMETSLEDGEVLEDEEYNSEIKA